MKRPTHRSTVTATPVHFALCILHFSLCTSLPADDFTIRLDNGSTATINARLAGEGQKAHALELADGSWKLIPSDRIVDRTAGPDPKPLTPDELLKQINEEFSATRTISHIEKPFVIVLVRARPDALDPATERRYQAVVKKAATFFKGMQTNFLEFVKQARIETTAVKFPLAAVIFESDRHFDGYTVRDTSGQGGISAANISAYYNLESNRLVIRLSECTTFETPLHEAVHQQVYNRGILQRFAPVPMWFNEGIATGFEGDGERVRSGPKSISDRYARMALKARTVDWAEIVARDQPFQGDVLAAEAYGHAWGLHWLLVTKYRAEYNNLVKHYAAKRPLLVDRPDQRVAEFEKILGKSVAELEREFQQELPRAMARRKN
ncbi:MAG TPA: DUF1570 domain-containing protein [Planctomycetaceae bacterium]|nr:DUF1570 domain-containing protein [Planctomycetaceae bacterium]